MLEEIRPVLPLAEGHDNLREPQQAVPLALWKEILTPASMWTTLAINIHIPARGASMKTVQMTLDEDLVRSVDRVVKRIHTTRSAFTRDALRDALRKSNVSRLEQQHRKGYETHPVNKREFSVWEEEQAWGDE